MVAWFLMFFVPGPSSLYNTLIGLWDIDTLLQLLICAFSGLCLHLWVRCIRCMFYWHTRHTSAIFICTTGLSVAYTGFVVSVITHPHVRRNPRISLRTALALIHTYLVLSSCSSTIHVWSVVL